MKPDNPTSVYGLEPGVVYIVTKPIVDYHNGKFEIGDLLTFQGHSFLPYHGGHTVFFREKNMYLQEDDQSEILAGLGEYLAVHDASGRKRVLPALNLWTKGEGGLFDFLGSLCMFGASILVLFIEKRPGFLVWASILMFGTFTVVTGIEWWQARRK